jgi:hypothetical protein
MNFKWSKTSREGKGITKVATQDWFQGDRTRYFGSMERAAAPATIGRMTFLGIILMIQGFGALIADHFFDKSFGLLHLWLEGGALTAVAAGVGLLGLVVTVIGLTHDD